MQNCLDRIPSREFYKAVNTKFEPSAANDGEPQPSSAKRKERFPWCAITMDAGRPN